MNKSRINIFLSNLGWIYLAKILTQAIGLITTYIVLVKLPVNIFGEFNFLVNLFLLVQILNISPIQNIINRFLPELSQVGNKKQIKKIIHYSFLFGVLGTIVFFLVAIIFKNGIAAFFNIKNFENVLPFLFFYAITTVTKNISNAVTTSLLLNKKTAYINVFNSAIRLCLYIYFLDELYIDTLLLIEAVLALVFTIQLLIVFYKFIVCINDQHFVNNSDDVQLKKRISKFGLFSFFNEIGAGIIGKTSDYYIIAAISNQYQVGLYAFAYRIYDIIYRALPLQEVMTILRPLFFQKFSEKYEYKEFYNFYNFLVKLMLPIFVLPALTFLIFGKDFINILFEGKYNAAYLVTLIVLLSNITTAVFYPIGITLQLKERMDVLFYSKIIIVFSIIAGIWSMQNFGIIGVALATSIGDLLKNIFILFIIRKEKIIKYNIFEYKNYVLIFSIPLVIFYLISLIITYNIYSLFLSMIIFISVFILMIIWFHPFNELDLQLLVRISNRNKFFKQIADLTSRIANIIRKKSIESI